jgi:HNH endonuclease
MYAILRVLVGPREPPQVHAAYSGWSQEHLSYLSKEAPVYNFSTDQHHHARNRSPQQPRNVSLTEQERHRREQAKWFANNKDKAHASSARYHAANKDKINARRRARYAKNPDKALAANKTRRARKNAAPIRDLTAAQWQAIKAHYGHRCVYCHKKFRRLTQDHLTPLSQGGAHTVTNVVPACQTCNARKRTGPVLIPVQPLLIL